jgi:hypothetical protein
VLVLFLAASSLLTESAVGMGGGSESDLRSRDVENTAFVSEA